MKANTLGETIRQLRKRANITQEELADGICSSVSISRIENGTQMPSGTILESLLQKLGSSTYQLCDIYFKSDRQLRYEEKLDQIKQLIQFGHYPKAMELLRELEEKEEDNPKNRQAKLMLEGILDLQFFNNPTDAIDKLQEGLRLTKKDIDFDDFRNVLFTETEVSIINALLACYIKLERFAKAITLGQELIRSLRKQESSLKEFQVMRMNVLLNLSQCMLRNNEFEEAITYIEEAETIGKSGVEQVLLPEILFIKAKILFFQDKKEQSKQILFSIVPYMEMIGKQGIASLIRDFVRENFREEIPSYS